MKNLFRLMLLAGAVAMVSCSDDLTVSQQEADATIYTDALGGSLTLGAYLNYYNYSFSNIYVAEGDASSSIAFYTDELMAGYTCTYDANYSSWNGFAISKNVASSVEVMEYEGAANYEYEMMAYAAADADGDDTVVVGYYSPYWSDEWPGFTPTIKFSTAANLKSIAVAPAAIVASYCKQTLYDWSTYEPIADPDYTFTLSVVGVDASGNTVATTSVDLADADFMVTTGWTTLDLSSFDGVSSLQFYVSCADGYAPTYFCIDDLIIE